MATKALGMHHAVHVLVGQVRQLSMARHAAVAVKKGPHTGIRAWSGGSACTHLHAAVCLLQRVPATAQGAAERPCTEHRQAKHLLLLYAAVLYHSSSPSKELLQQQDVMHACMHAACRWQSSAVRTSRGAALQWHAERALVASPATYMTSSERH